MKVCLSDGAIHPTTIAMLNTGTIYAGVTSLYDRTSAELFLSATPLESICASEFLHNSVIKKKKTADKIASSISNH